MVVSSDLKTRKDVVTIFCETRKALVMVTGHAHGYERFENVNDSMSCSRHLNLNDNLTYKGINDLRSQPIQFIVSGGGGGPRPTKLRKDYLDSFKGPSPRPFNFLIVGSSEDGMKISVQSLNKGQTQIHELEEIHLKYAL